jgi:hypothetical protein
MGLIKRLEIYVIYSVDERLDKEEILSCVPGAVDRRDNKK